RPGERGDPGDEHGGGGPCRVRAIAAGSTGERGGHQGRGDLGVHHDERTAFRSAKGGGRKGRGGRRQSFVGGDDEHRAEHDRVVDAVVEVGARRREGDRAGASRGEVSRVPRADRGRRVRRSV